MTETYVDELIKDIAVRHGVALSPDDPILIVSTLNRKLISDGAEAQEAILQTFKEELEGITGRWNAESKERAERILNAALTASKEAMTRTMNEASTNIVNRIQAEAAVYLRSAREEAKAIRTSSMLILAASGVSFLASAGALLAWAANFSR